MSGRATYRVLLPWWSWDTLGVGQRVQQAPKSQLSPSRWAGQRPASQDTCLRWPSIVDPPGTSIAQASVAEDGAVLLTPLLSFLCLKNSLSSALHPLPPTCQIFHVILFAQIIIGIRKTDKLSEARAEHPWSHSFTVLVFLGLKKPAQRHVPECAQLWEQLCCDG